MLSIAKALAELMQIYAEGIPVGDSEGCIREMVIGMVTTMILTFVMYKPEEAY